ncbi:MAG: mycofactocin radical SAM maturase [Streptosporangiaceae bacterium]
MSTKSFDLDSPWRLDDRTAVRPESFGAMLYNFGTRGLSFLKRTTLLDVLRQLDGQPSARAACAAAGIAAAEVPAYSRALRSLAASGMIVPRGGVGGPSDRVQNPGQAANSGLAGRFERGLDAPICLTWELTYACNLSCVHCLSSSGRRDPHELTTAECESVIDTLRRMQVFYVNIGGGEPTVRPDFWHLVDYATAHQVGVKFSTNGIKLDAVAAQRLAASDYVDVQISLDGATAEVNDAVRGAGSFATATRAMRHLAEAGFEGFKVSVVITRENVSQLDEFKRLADSYGAQLRLTRLRPSGRGADVWSSLHPLPQQQKELYDWLVANGDGVLTGDSFFHLSAYGEALPGLNLCGAGRVVCLIDPVGDVYACPFAIHENFLAGNVRDNGGFATVWRSSELFTQLREPSGGGACQSCGHYDSCRGGCMAAKFFTGLPLDGPDPECVQGYGELALATAAPKPRPSADHSHRTIPVTIGHRPPSRACDENPLAG